MNIQIIAPLPLYDIALVILELIIIKWLSLVRLRHPPWPSMDVELKKFEFLTNR